MTWDRPGSRPDAPSAGGTLLYMLVGPILWGAQLTAIYIGHTVVCTQGVEESWARPVIAAITLACLVTLSALLLRLGRVAQLLGIDRSAEGRVTYDRIALMIGIMSVFAILWSGGTAAILQVCVQGR